MLASEWDKPSSLNSLIRSAFCIGLAFWLDLKADGNVDGKGTSLSAAAKREEPPAAGGNGEWCAGASGARLLGADGKGLGEDADGAMICAPRGARVG